MRRTGTVVVGAGAAGAAVTWYLARAGEKVVCIDRGGWVDQTKVGTSHADWYHAKQSHRNHLWSNRDSNWDYPIDDSDSPIQVSNFNAIGGSTILFSGHFPRFLRRDFRTRSLDGFGVDWPIDYDSLLPFFELNEQRMHLSGECGGPYFPEIRSLRRPVDEGMVGAKLRAAFTELDWHVQTSFASINTESSTVLDRCRNLGPCNIGCPRNAKATADQIYAKPALELGAEIVSEAEVARVLMRGKRAIGVQIVDTKGLAHEIYADRVVVAASAIGTPRILLNSRSEEFPNGVGNQHDQLGRNLMIHPMAYVEGHFEEELDTDVGPQGSMVFSLQFHRVLEEGFEAGYMLHPLRGENPILAAQTALERGQLGFGEKLKPTFADSFRKRLGVAAVIEDLPESTNRVQLDQHTVNQFGMPGAKVTYTLSLNSRKLLKHAVKMVTQLLRVAGAKSTIFAAPVGDTGWHTLGTARMGSNPEAAVTDPRGRVFGVDGLFIADSSVFPTSSSVNPANTVQAVALHIADGIINES